MPQLLQDLGANGTDLIVYFSLALVFGAVVLVVVGTTTLVGSRTSLKERVGAAGVARAGGRSAGPGSIRLLDDASRFGVLGPIAKRLIPADLTDVSRTRVSLVQA